MHPTASRQIIIPMTIQAHPARCLLLLTLTTLPAHASKPEPPPDHWVGTWATANYAAPGKGFGQADMTYREIVHTTLAGPLMRVELSNQFGTEPLTIGAVHAALVEVHPSHPGDINLISANALTFNGQPSIIIPPGAIVVSDPAALALPAGADLAISLFLPAQKISTVTQHGTALTTSFIAPGNVVGRKTLDAPQTTRSWAFLRAVDIKSTFDTAAVVAFGDSITDGHGSTPDGNDRWADVFARRLQGNKKTNKLAVLNEGMGGNRILHDGTGPSALARFDTVLALPGVRYIILMEGINDIGHGHDPRGGSDVVTTADLTQGFNQLVERAHAHGIKVIGATLTPYMGAGYSSPDGETERKEYNAFLRTSKQLDGLIDFDAATRDRTDPDRFRQDFQSGDQLHPSPAGYKAMGDSIDLKLFELNKKEKYDITHQE